MQRYGSSLLLSYQKAHPSNELFLVLLGHCLALRTTENATTENASSRYWVNRGAGGPKLPPPSREREVGGATYLPTLALILMFHPPAN